MSRLRQGFGGPEAEQRAAVVAEALSWQGTRYHHMGRQKGAIGKGLGHHGGGVDCAMLPAEVYAACGLIPRIQIAHYPPDWHLHRGEERYLAIVQSYAVPADAPLPGDFVLWRVGRALAHGAIIVTPGWPHIIHADMEAKHVILARGDGGRLEGRAPHFFTLWPKKGAAGALAA